MRGGARVADFFCSAFTTSWRACLRIRPSATSRLVASRARTNATPCQKSAPTRSMTVSQETPNASDTPAIHAASKRSVAPRKCRPEASPCPTRLPTTPPAVCRSTPGDQCSVVSPQLAMSTMAKPATFTAVLARVLRSSFFRLRKMNQHHTPSMTGSRNAGRPNRKNRTSANQAPTGPIRLWTSTEPAAMEKPGSSGL